MKFLKKGALLLALVCLIGSFSITSNAATLTDKVKPLIEASRLTISTQAVHTNWSYGSYSYGITYKWIRTPASNIGFVSLQSTQNLAQSGYYGINGGYFVTGANQTLSIAEKNGTPVIGGYPNYNGGWYNSGGGSGHPNRGTLVWSGSSFSAPVINSASEISGSHIWAQGGVSMSLGNSYWRTQAVNVEDLWSPDADKYRTAMVGAPDGYVYLIVTNTACTASEFRIAIQSFYGITDTLNGTSVYKGIFLDGGGSSQLKCSDGSYAGDGRALVQIVRLINTN